MPQKTRLIDLTGQKFNRWTVLERAPCKRKNVTEWLCRCDCGTTKSVKAQALTNSLSKSCGCWKIELTESIKLTPKQKAANRAAASSIKDKTPKRREEKRLNQMRYVNTPKAIWAAFNRWAKKRKNIILITEEEYFKFRENPCTKCGKAIEGLGQCFSLIYPRRAVEVSNMIPCCGICKLIKPKESFDPINFAKTVLRRYWKKTPMVSMARQRARKERGRYECAKCLVLFKEKEIQIDHIDPVVEIDKGFIDLDTFARRLLCDDRNLQTLCKECHLVKTTKENAEREVVKKNKLTQK